MHVTVYINLLVCHHYTNTTVQNVLIKLYDMCFVLCQNEDVIENRGPIQYEHAILQV